MNLQRQENTKTTYWKMIKEEGINRYEAFLLIRQGNKGTYRPTNHHCIRRWTSNDQTLVLDIRSDFRHVSCIIG